MLPSNGGAPKPRPGLVEASTLVRSFLLAAVRNSFSPSAERLEAGLDMEGGGAGSNIRIGAGLDLEGGGASSKIQMGLNADCLDAMVDP